MFSASRACFSISSVDRGLSCFSSIKRGTGGGASMSSVTPGGSMYAGASGLLGFGAGKVSCADATEMPTAKKQARMT